MEKHEEVEGVGVLHHGDGDDCKSGPCLPCQWAARGMSAFEAFFRVAEVTSFIMCGQVSSVLDSFEN